MDQNRETYHDEIDAYLRDELSLEEKALFKKSLQKNPELLEEFRIHQELFLQVDESGWTHQLFSPDKKEVAELETYFRSEEALKLKNTITKIRTTYNRKNASSFFSNKTIISILVAASIALFVVLFTMNSDDSSEELYAQYSQWEDLPSLTSRSDETQLANGQHLFEENKFEESYNLFTSYNDDNSKIKPSLLIYIGLSALELNKYEEAISYFDQLIQSDAVDQSKGYWYKALAYLKQDKREEAISVLEIIRKNETNYKYITSKELLDKLL